MQGGRVDPDDETEAGRDRSRSRRERAQQTRVHRRRRAVAGGLVAVAAIALVLGVISGAGRGDGEGADESSSDGVESEPTVELPRGGTELFPDFRLVGYYGAPQDEELGALGIGTPAQASKQLDEQAAAYDGNRPVLPFLELIATVANADPGEDGKYRTQQPRSVIEDYLAQAREDRSLLILDIQPGLASFPAEVERLERYLSEPDVGLALDPEWHIDEGEVPGQVIGSVDAGVVNRIASRLSETVETNNLPEKLLIVHQFTEDMIVGKDRLKTYPGVQIVLNVDGFGDPPSKIQKYKDLHPPKRSGLHSGFKLFYKEDTDLMSPRDVLKLKPRPDLVVYE